MKAGRENLREQASARDLPGRRNEGYWTPIIVFASIIAAYSNAFLNPFLYGDDERLITRNLYLKDWGALGKLLTQSVQAGSGQPTNFYRPVQLIHYAVIAHAAGIVPWAFHGVGILYHAANAVLLYFLLRKLTGPALSPVQAALLALLWGLHPIQVEDVSFANGTATPLYLFGTLAACLLFLNGRTGWALAATMFALGSKEAAVVIPPLLALLDWAQIRSGRARFTSWKETALRHAPQWILAGAYVLSRLTILNFGGTLNFYSRPNAFTEHFSYRLYTLFTIYAGSLKLLVWPSGLHPERSWPMFTSLAQSSVLWSAALLCILLGFAIRWRKSIPLAAAGILWFFVAYAPMSNLFAEINSLFWEHWLYAPSVGIVLALAGGWAYATKNGRPWAKAQWLLAALVGVLGILTFERNFKFDGQEIYSRYILSYEPASAKHWTNLAIALADRREYQEAIKDYAHAIELDDEYPQTRYNLANAYLSIGRPDLAEEQYRLSLRIDPTFYFSDLSLGNLYLATGHKDKALAAFESAYRIFPELPGLREEIEVLKK